MALHRLAIGAGCWYCCCGLRPNTAQTAEQAGDLQHVHTHWLAVEHFSLLLTNETTAAARRLLPFCCLAVKACSVVQCWLAQHICPPLLYDLMEVDVYFVLCTLLNQTNKTTVGNINNESEDDGRTYVVELGAK